jgi:hypothetical protein
MTVSAKPSFWCCDKCNRLINHGEFRYNCIVCDDYDYCEECTMTVGSLHPHQMMRELAYGEAEEKEHSQKSMATGIQNAIGMYSDRNCMGVRDVDKNNPLIYADSYSLRRLIEPRGYLGICAANRPEWAITDFACILQSIISVPIYYLCNDCEITHIINNTQVSVLVCDKHMLSRIMTFGLELCPSLRHIVCIDPIPDTICGKFIVLTESLARFFTVSFVYLFQYHFSHHEKRSDLYSLHGRH